MADGFAAFSLRPSFASLPAGAPIIPLSKLHAVLTGPSGEPFSIDAPFVGDSAVLSFEVPISGASAVFSLNLAAFDTKGVVAFTSTQDLTLHAGDNPPPSVAPLVPAGPDAGVAALHIKPGPITMGALATANFSVTGTDAAGRDIPSIRVGWVSRDPSVAAVDENGTVKAGSSQGATRIVARAANGTADSVAIKVQAPVDRVVLSTSTLNVFRGGSITLTAELRDAANHVIDDRTASWTSSDPSVASVSADGGVVGVKVGKATLTASAEGKTAAVSVTVASPVDHIELTPGTLSFASLNQTISLVAKLVPAAGASTTGMTAKLTSATPAVATVDANGVVTAVGNGLAKITAELDDKTASIDATVAQVAVTVAVSPQASSVSTLSQTRTLTTNAVDAKSNKIAAPKVTWTSADPTIATVSGTGITATVSPHSAGATQITATVDGKSDVSTFIVAPTVAGIMILPSSPRVAPGQSITLAAKYADADGNPIGDVAATFSTSTPALVSLQGATLTGLAPGIAKISATSAQYSASLSLTVGNFAPQMVVFGDAEFLGNGAVEYNTPDQLKFLDNLISNPSGGARAQNHWVLFYRGHNSACASNTVCTPGAYSDAFSHWSSSEIVFAYDTTDVAGDALSNGLDPNVSVLFLVMPTTPFNAAEISGLKQFAVEGGRIVFLGGRVEDYDVSVENAFLTAMGSTMQANADDQWCDKPLLTGASLKPHQLTNGVGGLSLGCASSLSMGATGTPVILDGTLNYVLGAVTTIDPTGAGTTLRKKARPAAIKRPK